LESGPAVFEILVQRTERKAGRRVENGRPSPDAAVDTLLDASATGRRVK
jgi:hypothetical protein